MTYIDILSNILTSTFVVGIATYFIQKRIDSRFNKIEEFQKTLITIRKERYDTLLKTLQEIWEKIVETEFYVKYELVEQIKAAQEAKLQSITFDSSPLKQTYIFIQKKSIVLNQKLSDKTKSFFENYLLKAYNGYIETYRQAKSNKKTLEDLNNYIPSIIGDKTNYKKDLDALREMFEVQARQILYDENKKDA
jgi:hypothetical protein